MEFVYTSIIKEKLNIAKNAKVKHKASIQCEESTLSRCTACHFWSGTISAYSELLGNPGVID